MCLLYLVLTFLTDRFFITNKKNINKWFNCLLNFLIAQNCKDYQNQKPFRIFLVVCGHISPKNLVYVALKMLETKHSCRLKVKASWWWPSAWRLGLHIDKTDNDNNDIVFYIRGRNFKTFGYFRNELLNDCI